jgi:hypothetical protein
VIDGVIDQAILKAKARTGAGEDVALWLAAAVVLALLAIVFLSVALYVWLAGLYGGAIAALDVGALYAALAAAAIARGVVVRRRNRLLARQRLAAIAAAKTNPWPIDPALLAVGLEIGKAIGWRRLVPLAVAGVGVFAAISAAGRGRPDAPDEPPQQND